MSLVWEVALTPDLFLETAYSTPAVYPPFLELVKAAVLDDTFIRNLRGGLWEDSIAKSSLPVAGRELFKNLLISRRLVNFPPQIEIKQDPSESREWALEALAGHKTSPLAAVLVGSEARDEMCKRDPCCWIEEIQGSTWWRNRSPSLRLKRRTEDYLRVLKIPLERSNSLMFIDPYLNPTRPNYGEFHKLIEAATKQRPAPILEFHRGIRDGAGAAARILSKGDAEQMFEPIAAVLTRANRRATVFLWDEFHDRYLISDLLGMSIPNGFDVTRHVGLQETTWTRLSLVDRDNVQREFDRNSTIHTKQLEVEIGV